MKMKTHITVLSLLALIAGNIVAGPLGTAFTYQGRLDVGVNAANGSYDLAFTLYDGLDAGSVVGTPQTNLAVAISGGLFTVALDFGSDAFPGAARWLEMGVRSNGIGEDFTILSPRQELTPTPYALYARIAGTAVTTSNFTGRVFGGQLMGTYSNSLTLDNVGNTFKGDGEGLMNVNALKLDGYPCWNLPYYWKLTGNAGTDAGVNFVGTTDDEPLEFKVFGQRALRLEPHATSPNVIGGYSDNAVAGGIYGASIGGGGSAGLVNAVNANFGTIGGGYWNTIEPNAWSSTISGGSSNIIQSSADRSTIGGGYWNTIKTNARSSTISGGSVNTIETNANNSTISGGRDNTIETNAWSSTISGGTNNTIQSRAYSSTIGGGAWNRIQTNANNSTISGGSGNTIQTNATHATIGGGGANDIADRSGSSTIGGGWDSNIGTNSSYSTIAGGHWNTITDNSAVSSIGGGEANRVENDVLLATIGGGQYNTIASNAHYATIPGGKEALASSYGQMAYASGRFANNGDAQSSLYVARRSTSGLVTSGLFLDGGSRRLVVPNNTVWTFEGQVAARSSAGEIASYTIRGIISNAGGTTTLPVAATVTTVYESDAAWGVAVSADDANEAMVVNATGNTGDTIRWVATVRTAEVTY